MIEEQYWIESARQLATLFSRMPDVKPAELGANAQNFLETYKPTTALWDEHAENLRDSFVRMTPRQFASIYETYMRDIRK